METKYTMLVSTVTAPVAVYTSLLDQLQRPVAHLRCDNDLTRAIERGCLPEANAAAERHS
jgi:hypothetical protein